jgi:hypothetical protein
MLKSTNFVLITLLGFVFIGCANTSPANKPETPIVPAPIEAPPKPPPAPAQETKTQPESPAPVELPSPTLLTTESSPQPEAATTVEAQPAPLQGCAAGDVNQESPLASHQVYRAFSNDGYEFTAEDKLLIDHASVPEGAIGPDGAMWVYFINGEAGKHGLFVAREEENGQWQLIDCVRLNGQFEGNAVDPDVIRLSDGRYRLFYFLGNFVSRPQPGQSPEHPIFSAISEDGIHFTIEQQLIAVEGVTDPTVAQLPNGGWLMALAQVQENRTLLAASADGYNFELTGVVVETPGIPELTAMPDGRVRLYLSNSLISEDGGQTWAEETQRFVPGPDPSLVAMPDGSYTMFYKKFSR